MTHHIKNMPLLALLALFAGTHVHGAFTREALLNSSATEYEGPAGAGFTHFNDLLDLSSVDDTFMEDSGFEGSLLAFTDQAFETLATGHGFADAAAFKTWLTNREDATDLATMVINLHVIPSLRNSTGGDDVGEFAQARNGAGLVKLVHGEGGDVTQFVYPTLKYAPGDDSSSSEDSSSSSSGNETSPEPNNDRRKLLDDHGASVLAVVNGGDPTGSKRCYYLDTALAPVALVNLAASQQETVYVAISNAPALSLFKAMLDEDVDGMAEIRSELNQTGFDGTVLAPHDDAIRTFLADLDVTLARLRDDFPRVLRMIVEYHTLPFNFTTTELTRPGNGIGGPGNNRGRMDQDRPGSNRGGAGDNNRGGVGDNNRGGAGNSNNNQGGPGNNNRGGNGPNGVGEGSSNGRALLNEDVKNRFQTRRPGTSNDLNIIKTGNGRVFITGRMGRANLMTPESEINVNDRAYVHIIDSVLRVANVAADRSANGLFGAGSRVKPVGANFNEISALLEQAGLFEGGQITLGCKTLIAPSDETLPDTIENAEELLAAHTLLLGPYQSPSDGDVIATELTGTNVKYSEDEDGTGSFSFTDEEVNLERDGCGAAQRKGSRRLLASGTAPAGRRLLQTSARVEGFASLGDDGQIIYASGALTNGEDGGDGRDGGNSAQAAVPKLSLLAAATLAVLALLSI